ncbi:MAG: diguanylate cyclase [Thermoleophilia bacterium]
MTDLERANQRAERERRARLAAEEIAERVTRELYDTVRDLREAEARARIVGETAVEVFTTPLALSDTLAGIAASAERALGARRVTCAACAPGRPADAIDGADPERGQVALPLSHASIADGGREVLLGVLRIELAEPRLLTDAELLVARSLAALASMALANARLHEQTLRSLADAERRAATDPLTGLANHRAFQERLAAEVQRAARHGRPLALAVMDLDHFKRVNDSHGHLMGDRVLVEAGRILQAEARRDDLVARMGGEEFAWLMPETDDASAWEAADRARAAMAAHDFSDVGRVTISAGVCDLAAAGDGERLFALADRALYWAKHHGRDLVVRHAPDQVDAR